MGYRALGDAVVVLHLAFIVFVAVGGFLAWRWPWTVWVHLPAVAWGAAIVAIGFDCPLTPLEKWLRERGGEDAYDGGFVDRYVEDVIYPDEYTPHLRALAVVLIAIAYVGILRRRVDLGHQGGADPGGGAPPVDDRRLLPHPQPPGWGRSEGSGGAGR